METNSAANAQPTSTPASAPTSTPPAAESSRFRSSSGAGSASSGSRTSSSGIKTQEVRLPNGVVDSRAVTSDSPVVSTPDGQAMYRTGPLRRGSEYYQGDALADFRSTKGNVNPSVTPGLLSNPYRDDGTARLPNDTKEKGLYTENNYWYTGNGNEVVEGRKGGAYYRNNSNTNVLVAGGLIPGNEQPGAAMTVVKRGGEEVQALRPPAQNEGLRNGGQPEIYNSVGNIDPTDAVGWRYSNARPNDDPANSDYGTAQYAYRTDVIGSDENLFAGLSTNEGYDPELSQKPGYGIALYSRDKTTGEETLQGLVHMDYQGGDTATARMWGNPASNPQAGEVGVSMQIGKDQLGENIEFVYEYKTPSDITALLDSKVGEEGYVTNEVKSTKI